MKAMNRSCQEQVLKIIEEVILLAIYAYMLFINPQVISALVKCVTYMMLMIHENS